MNECADSNCTLATPDEEPPGQKEPPSNYLPDSSGYSHSSLAVADPPLAGTAADFPLVSVDALTPALDAPRSGRPRAAPRWRRFPVTNRSAARLAAVEVARRSGSSNRADPGVPGAVLP